LSALYKRAAAHALPFKVQYLCAEVKDTSAMQLNLIARTQHDHTNNPSQYRKRGHERHRAYWIAFIAFPFIAAQHSHAQVDTGSIVGTVVDTTGAVVPAATLTVADESNGRKEMQQSGQDGSYTFSPLRIGTYTMTVSRTGFA
jgi:hypothetical protein